MALLVNDDDPEMTWVIHKLYGDRYPELKELAVKDWNTNRAPHMVLTTAIPRKIGGNDIREKYIFGMVYKNIESTDLEKQIWEKYNVLINELERLNRSKVSMPIIEGVGIEVQCRTLECITGRAGIRVDLYSPASFAAKVIGSAKTSSATIGVKTTSTPNTATPLTGKQWQFPKNKKYETIIVGGKDKKTQPEELIREIKSRIDITKFEAQVRTLTSTRNGKIAIRLPPAKGSENKALCEAILKQLDTVEAEIYRDTTAILIKDLDHAVNAEEIETTISKALYGDNKIVDFIDINGLKKPVPGRALTATALLPAANAVKILDKKRICIGWNMCRVNENLVPTR